MKNNWLGVFCGGFCAFFSSTVFALGLGGITTESVINEPLIAEIELINVGDLENTQILVDIGTDSDYELAGVAREFFHSDLQFEVQVEDSGKPRILVRTRSPLQDPYLNFMVQIRWPQGKLLREYTLLLDMPVFSKQEAAPAASRQSEPPAPTTAREAVAQSRTTSQTGRQTTTSSRQTAASRPSTNAASGRDYRVSSGDTLWGLAGDVASRAGISRHQAMLAIHERNTGAFVNGDINRLKADTVLSIPSESQMSQRSEGQAVRDFSSLSQDATATPIQSGADNFRRNSEGQNTVQSGRLALSSNDNNGIGGANAANDDANAELAQQALTANAALSETLTENAALKEQLDAAEIEKQELADRLANLEEQLELLSEQAALEVDSDDLAAIQAATEAAPEENTVAPAPEPETFMDKVMGLRYWIFGALALIFVIALLVVLLVMRKRKSSDVEELYYDEADDEYDEQEQLIDEDYEDEFDEVLPEDEEDDLEEGIDEITKDLSDADDSEEDSEEHSRDEEEQDEDDELESEAMTSAESFDDAEEDNSLDLGEFEDLDEFFSDESADATNVLFGADTGSSDAEEGEPEQDLPSESEQEEEESLDFSVGDLDVDDSPEAAFEHDEEDSLEFEVGDMTISEDAPVEDSEIDLENKFDFTESDVTKDLAPDAAEQFEESIEVHSSEMEELLVPSSDEALSEDDELFLGESPSSESDDLDAELDDAFVEQLDEDVESLLEEDNEEETPSGSILDLDEDLNLDEDMDADLGDLDLDGDVDATDDDEEFLTKLELAEAYIEMGDLQGATELLKEVEKDGNAEQQATAKSLLENAKG